MNTLSLLTTPRSFYLKLPKEALGGGAIWDFAAVTLMLTEAQGSAQSYHGLPLSMNRVERIFFNDVGITCVSSDLSYAEISSMIHIDQAEPQEARLDQNES